MSQPKSIKGSFSQQDLAFMQSLSAAVLETTPKRIRIVLVFWIVAVVLVIGWASIARIDEIARGAGEIVPSGDNQIIQNLEGGIIQEIMVAAGDRVSTGQVLLKINNQKSESVFAGSEIKAMELEARLIRLTAEASGQAFKPNADASPELKVLVDRELSLFNSNQAQLHSQQNVLEQQLAQRVNERKEVGIQLKHIKRSRALVKEEVVLTEPVVAKGIKPMVDFLKLKREANAIEEQYQSLLVSIPRLESAIIEAKSKLSGLNFQLQSKAKKELNEVSAELDRIYASNTALEDQVHRTLVRAPGNGIIQSLFVHTLGGVVKPGADLVEIVPSDDILWVEAKIKPSDIAFIYPGQKVMVKFTAYDFAIYGGLEGKVVKISADTQFDRQENPFYTVHVKTDANFLGREHAPLKIIPGMTVSVDIVTGEKTVLDYILKPILRAKQYTFTER